ncbi:hypothetical protein IU469_30955 [Nocardia puris]|uniref:hypothetical protein n=1 Tax=Nocardia puris TaxID=208602 RepID=UPI0018963702|nr:hypothetical protein [Nocardia puris]MBF6370094.1 hypothetical protein [Nocardia puris]
MKTTIRSPDNLTDILDPHLGTILSAVTDTLDQAQLAEEEIAAAQSRLRGPRHRQTRSTVWHAFSLLTPTHPRMTHSMVYRAHCRELLDRVVSGTPTQPGTAAEILMALSEANSIAPLTTPAFGLWLRMWRTAGLPPVESAGDSEVHYQAIAADRIDELERQSRSKLAVPTRVLGEIDCHGYHHGEPVDCLYNRRRSRAAQGHRAA